MTDNNIDLTLDTTEPLSPIEPISDQEDAFNEEDLDAQKIDSAKIDPTDLAQHSAMAAGYFDGAIPTDIAAPPGLSPKRAELARSLEWRRRTANEIEVLEEARHRAIEALGGEASTKKKIDALIAKLFDRNATPLTRSLRKSSKETIRPFGEYWQGMLNTLKRPFGARRQTVKERRGTANCLAGRLRIIRISGSR